MHDDYEKELPCNTCKNAGSCPCDKCERAVCFEHGVHFHDMTVKEVKAWECYEKEEE